MAQGHDAAVRLGGRQDALPAARYRVGEIGGAKTRLS